MLAVCGLQLDLDKERFENAGPICFGSLFEQICEGNNWAAQAFILECGRVLEAFLASKNVQTAPQGLYPKLQGKQRICHNADRIWQTRHGIYIIPTSSGDIYPMSHTNPWWITCNGLERSGSTHANLSITEPLRNTAEKLV